MPPLPLRPKFSKRKLDICCKSFSEKGQSAEELVRLLKNGLATVFGYRDSDIILYDPTSTTKTSYVHHTISEKEIQWIVEQTKEWALFATADQAIPHWYIDDRTHWIHTDPDQLRQDCNHYSWHCRDQLFIPILSEERYMLGLVRLQEWADKRLLTEKKIRTQLPHLMTLVHKMGCALDNVSIHQKIELLVAEKHSLKQRIQQDMRDLDRRLLELTVLYDTSNALSHSLSYSQVVALGMEAIYKVLKFDVGAVFLVDFVTGGEIITRINTPVESEFVKKAHANVLAACMPFLKRKLDINRVRVTMGYHIRSNSTPSSDIIIQSFANIPILFKEELLGMLNMCSIEKTSFSKNDLTFLHTMANQLASHLGRLKMMRKIEKSKVSALLKSMNEGIIMLGVESTLEFINPAAKKLLAYEDNTKVLLEDIWQTFKKLEIETLVHRCIQDGKNISSYEVPYKNQILLLDITKVNDTEQHKIGTVIVLRDATKSHHTNRINSRRLEVISRLNMIIKSFSADLDDLLTVVLEFILGVANVETGAIQVLQEGVFVTKVHSNFPDKIFNSYRFKNGQPIVKYVIDNQQLVFIENYRNSPNVHSYSKVALEEYVCMPIMAKNDFIGIVHLARKAEDLDRRIAEDDVTTIATITPLIGTAIRNAFLYQETLEKQKLEQELRVANEIQNKLLPEHLPQLSKVSLGAISLPARVIGGDYYDFIKLQDGNLGIVIADIVGKGIPAGLFMAMLKSILHTHLVPISSPKQALTQLNTLLIRDRVISKYVPLFYGILNPVTNVFTYANAGHEPALYFSKGQFSDLDTDGFPLGSLENGNYEEKSIQLSDHDWILLFTDGVIEARNEKKDSFDHIQLKNLLKKSSQSDADSFVGTVAAYFKTFYHLSKQHDDLTMVALKIDVSKKNNTPLKTTKKTVLSTKQAVKEIRNLCHNIATEMGFDESTVFNIKLALNEAHANIIEHAYEGRLDEEIVFKFLVYEDRLDIKIRDFGPDIEKKTTKSRAEHLDQLEGSGLGIFLIHSLVDKVEYTSGISPGSELIISKKLTKGVQHENP